MYKVISKIVIALFSLFSFAAFLFGISTLASYYIDALGFTFFSAEVVVAVCIFGLIVLALAGLFIYLIVVALRTDDMQKILVSVSILATNIPVSLITFVVGFLMIFGYGTNGCSYTTDIRNYGKGEVSLEWISYFPEEITDQMTVEEYRYFYKYIDASHCDIYLEVTFDDAETMEHYVLEAKEAFSENGYIEYQNPYNSAYKDFVENDVVSSSSGEKYAGRITFGSYEDRKNVDMNYRSVSYSYEELTIIYSYTTVFSEIRFGNHPNAGEYCPKYLERFEVRYDTENDFACKYRED